MTLTNLGVVASARGRLGDAELFYRRAAMIYERQAPGSDGHATTLANLASVLARRGDLVAAEEYHLRALTLREGMSPDSPAVAASLNPWQCGNAYVPWNQLSGNMGNALFSRNLCGPRRAPFRVALWNEHSFRIAYQVGVGRCIAVNTNPAIAGSAYMILAKSALNVWSGAVLQGSGLVLRPGDQLGPHCFEDGVQRAFDEAAGPEE